MNFLEQYVQWLAIGLGAVFALFMVYTYVLQSPAKVTIGQDTLTGGEVDPYIVDHVAKSLEGQFDQPGKIDLAVPTYVQSFRDTMNWVGVKPVDFAGGFPALPPLEDSAIASNANPTNATDKDGVPIPNVEKVTELPSPPPAIPAESKFGRSVIVPTVAGGQPPPAPQPGQPAVAGIDKDWVTQLFHINIADLQKAFVKSKIPAKFSSTMFLQVEMQREELDDNGNPIPGTQQIIAPLDVWRNNVAPPPFPPEDAQIQQGPYLQWAAANTADILEPLFYSVLKGDQWTKPGAQVSTIAVFDPATFRGDLSTLTPDQKAAVMKARQEADKAARDAKKAAHPARPATPSSPGGAPGFNGYVLPDYAPAPHQPTHPPGTPHPPARVPSPDGASGAAPPAITGMEGPGAGGLYGGGGPAGIAPGSVSQPGVDFPNGEFDPTAAPWNTKTIDGWCHDQTVVANKTYRYRIRYKLKNPVLGAGNVTDPPQLSNTFALVALWSDWSSPVTIPPLINLFVAGNRSPNGTVIQFQVFKWEKGEQRSATFPIAPGDEVGGVDPKTGIDFATGWSVVDFRDDPRNGGETQILLVNDQTGKLVARSYNADRNDPLFKGLKEQVIAAKALETAAAGAPGGAPPVVR